METAKFLLTSQVGLFVLSIILSVFFAIWASFEISSLTRHEGKIKRGIKIWQKPLKEKHKNYLLSVSTDVVEIKKVLSFDVKVGFIRVKKNEAIIRYRRFVLGKLWLYIGYVNFSNPESVLEFRSSLPMFLMLSPFIVSIVLIPVAVLLVIINYRAETKAIENFLDKKSKE